MTDKTFIETQFPVSKLSKESYKERSAKQGQTLTGLGKWWGRKPLIMIRAVILGLLMPISNDPKKDRDIFLKLLTMDEDGLWRRKNKAIPLREIYHHLTADERRRWFKANGNAESPKYQSGLTREDKQAIQRLVFDRLSYKDDLDRQHAMLEAYCAAKGWRSEIIRDLGSGMNYHKKGLQRLLELILRKKMRRLVLTHKDRLLRFGAELVFALCELQGIEIVIIHKGEQPAFEQELAEDVLEIITVLSARLYGSRSKRHRKWLADLQESGDKIANVPLEGRAGEGMPPIIRLQILVDLYFPSLRPSFNEFEAAKNRFGEEYAKLIGSSFSGKQLKEKQELSGRFVVLLGVVEKRITEMQKAAAELVKV